MPYTLPVNASRPTRLAYKANFSNAFVPMWFSAGISTVYSFIWTMAWIAQDGVGTNANGGADLQANWNFDPAWLLTTVFSLGLLAFSIFSNARINNRSKVLYANTDDYTRGNHHPFTATLKYQRMLPFYQEIAKPLVEKIYILDQHGEYTAVQQRIKVLNEILERSDKERRNRKGVSDDSDIEQARMLLAEDDNIHSISRRALNA